MKHRKPYRPDWRKQPAKRTIPAMTEWHLRQYRWKRFLTTIREDIDLVAESVWLLGKVIADTFSCNLPSAVKRFRLEPRFAYKVDHPPYLVAVDLVRDKGDQSVQIEISRELKHP